MTSLLNKIKYILIRSTGNPEHIEEIGNMRYEHFYFTFPLVSFSFVAVFQTDEGQAFG